MKIPEKIAALLHWSRSGREIPGWALILGLLACFLLAAALRIYAWHVEPVLSRDGVGYVRRAQEIQEQRSGLYPDKVYPPTLPTPHYIYSAYLSLPLFSLSPHALGVVTNILLGSFLPLLLGAIALLLWKRKDFALACAFLGAVFPPWVAWSIEVQREIPHLFFSSCFVWVLLLYLRRSSWYWSAAMGCFSALSIIARYEGGELTLFSLVLFAFLIWKTPKDYKKRLLHGGIMLFAVLVVITLIVWSIGISPGDFLKSSWQKFSGCIR